MEVPILADADIVIHDCIILPMNTKEHIENGAIAIKNGKIVFIGKSTSIPTIKAEKQIHAKNMVALPGLINSHTHVAMTLFRGIAEEQPLDLWLEKFIWPLEAKLKPADVYFGALLGCLEMIKSGTTCFADMYFHENMVARAVCEAGLRGVLAEGIIEVGKKFLGKMMLKRSVAFATRFRGYADGRVTTMLGPHAAYSCSKELLIKACREADRLNVGLHVHLAESKVDFPKCSSSEVEFLDNIGFFGRHVLAAHCINLSSVDRNILSKRSVNVVHVPVANMKLGLGAAKIKDLVDLGVNVCLGTDGPASNNSLDMFETIKVACLLQKLIYKSPLAVSAYDVLKMATVNGAKALGQERKIGSLEVGKKADLILIDFSKPHLKPTHNIYANLVFSAKASDVDTVIVDGRILMENRHVKTLNENVIMESADKTSINLLSR